MQWESKQKEENRECMGQQFIEEKSVQVKLMSVMLLLTNIHSER